MSAGVRLKKATSDPDTSALAISSIAMQMEGIRLPLDTGSIARSRAVKAEFKIIVCVQQSKTRTWSEGQVISISRIRF